MIEVHFQWLDLQILTVLIVNFIRFKPAPFLDRQYTVFGKVISGMEFVDKIKKGDENNNGAVNDPDKIISFKFYKF